MKKELITINPIIPVKQLCLLIILACTSIITAAQEVTNQVDAKKRKQGPWIEQVASIRGEPGFSWEGVYKNDRKEGIWKKFTINGDLLAEETFKNGTLDGLCKYFYPDGKISAVGMMVTTDIEGQKDTILVIDPVTQEEQFVEVTRKGNSVRQGEWRIYDEDGIMLRETYERGEVTTSVSGNRKPANVTPLPHEQGAGKKKKGKE